MNTTSVYILYSPSLCKYYAGLSKDPHQRLRQHQKGASFWTRRSNDWEIVFEQKMGSLPEARILEKKIKARGAKRFLQDQLPNPA